MKGAVLYGPGDVRFEERPEPKIIDPTDAIISISAACVCGSDLWAYRGLNPVTEPTPMGHEYCGIVEEVGSAVRTVKPGRITAAGKMQEVIFEPVEGPMNDRIDDAYRLKYSGSPYLKPMIAARARAATVRIMPRDANR